MNICAGAPASICLASAGACRVGDGGLLAGLLLPLRIDGIERVLEAGGGEHHHVRTLRLCRLLRRPPGDQQGRGEAQSPAEPGASRTLHAGSPRAPCDGDGYNHSQALYTIGYYDKAGLSLPFLALAIALDLLGLLPVDLGQRVAGVRLRVQQLVEPGDPANGTNVARPPSLTAFLCQCRRQSSCPFGHDGMEPRIGPLMVWVLRRSIVMEGVYQASCAVAVPTTRPWTRRFTLSTQEHCSGPLDLGRRQRSYLGEAATGANPGTSPDGLGSALRAGYFKCVWGAEYA